MTTLQKVLFFVGLATAILTIAAAALAGAEACLEYGVAKWVGTAAWAWSGGCGIAVLVGYAFSREEKP